jgi:hypothetical protein
VSDVDLGLAVGLNCSSRSLGFDLKAFCATIRLWN